jgi:hypothetical protein
VNNRNPATKGSRHPNKGFRLVRVGKYAPGIIAMKNMLGPFRLIKNHN